MQIIDKEVIDKIKYHYEIANNLIDVDKINKAKYELFVKMSKNLYDISLDIMDNRNLINNNIDLKKLIIKTHNKLEPKELDKESDIDDNFIDF